MKSVPLKSVPLKRRVVATLAGLLGLAGVGCSGSGNACQDAFAVYCARACECTPGSTCAFAGDSGSIEFDSYDVCFGLFRVRGGGPPAAATVDGAACEAAAAAAACTPEGVSNMAACAVGD